MSGQECGTPQNRGDAEYQVQQTFFASQVEPDAVSTINLSGGRTIPYYFSLGINSTVPFVQLESGGGAKKEFSWGETVEVPPGQLLTVRNVSYMSGDIQIQSGKDYAPTPTRIQKYITLGDPTFNETPGIGFLRSTMFVDLRRARRAFLAFSTNPSGVIDLADPVLLSVAHYNKQHSTESPDFYFDNAIFVTSYTIPPFTAPGILPIGYMMAHMDPNSCVPQVLGDYVTLFIQYPTATLLPAELRPYIVMEYL